MKNKVFAILMSIVLLVGLCCMPVSADEGVYNVSDFEEFKTAVEEINEKTLGETYTIRLTGEIDFGRSGYNCKFLKNTVILGEGHTINLGSEQSNGQLQVMGDATLSLGKNNSTDNENQLKIMVAAPKRSAALILIGNIGESATLNMYDGVELTDSNTNGASLGSAVNIVNGEFNMYGGDIHGNTNDAVSGMGGAVAGDGRNGKIVFNMEGGTIRNNTTLTDYYGYGGGVFLLKGVFNMTGGSIRENTVEKTTENARGYGGGVMMYGGKAVLSGGEISNNTSANFGGGIFTNNGADLVIKRGFVITGNTSSVGGGLSNNGNSTVVEEGAVLANNKASAGGDDVAHYGESLTLAPAQGMNMLLSTDHSNHPITGWYLDYPRWQADSAQKIDVTIPLGKTTTFLKAAYANIYTVIYRFVSDSEGKALPDEVVDLLPNDTKEYHLGEQVTPIIPENTKVSVTDGVWEFKGYDAENKTIESVTTEFVGAWVFKSNISVLNEAPVIHANDKTIYIGNVFNPLENVSATDKEDGALTLTKENIIANTVNVHETGVYNVTYRVTDSQGASTSKTIKVTVKNNNKKADRNIPKTGDEGNFIYYIFLGAISISIVLIIFARKRRKNR